jgi:mannose-6-phosphate isomerase-like protein (cupin superfamily)
MLTIEQFLLFAHNKLAYEQHLISVIADGKDYRVNSFEELYGKKTETIKIEGMERYSKDIFDACSRFSKKYNHNGPVTCHAFYAPAGACSFDLHTDPDDVVIYCCEGIKTMFVDGNSLTILPGESIFIPANTIHKATNQHESLMLSFGLEKFLSQKAEDYGLDVLHKDNRNL